MNVGMVYNTLRQIDQLFSWPETADLFPKHEMPVRLDWSLPTYTLRSVGSEGLDPLPLVAALACIQISIILIDDILDDDPRGKQEEMGTGRAANFALALQAASHLLLQRLPLSESRRNALATSMQSMAFFTAVGQEKDVQEILDESSYWDLVEAKSTPYYATAFELGAIAGGASTQVCKVIYRLGAIFGEIIQVMDDLTDAFETPAKPDWKRQNNNLIILFAKTAEHPDRTVFRECLNSIGEPDSLRAAQSMLISSGAVSYGIYHILERYDQAQELLTSVDLYDADSLLALLRQQIQPVLQFLIEIGANVPARLYSIVTTNQT